MYKILIAAQLWFGYHPIVTGPGIPEGTRIVEMRGDLFVLNKPISYCQDSDGSIFGAETHGDVTTCIRLPRS